MLNGMWRLDGLLDQVAGETLATALAAALPKPSPEDTRTPTQRRADALIDICATSLANADRPHVGNERPNVNIVFHAADNTAHTSGNWFLRNWQIERVLCDANVTAIAATLNGVPFDVGTPTTAIPARNRKAVIIRDRGCRYPGCGHPPRWCEIHHIRERKHGGTHEPPNLVLMCAYHHREIHRKHIRLHWQANTLVAVMPNGTLRRDPPHPTLRDGP